MATGRLVGVTGSEYCKDRETGKPRACGARGEVAATVVARISKGVTGGLDVLDGGGIEGGKRADAGGGVLPMETGVRTSVQISGDGEVLSTEISSALLAEKRPDRY